MNVSNSKKVNWIGLVPNDGKQAVLFSVASGYCWIMLTLIWTQINATIIDLPLLFFSKFRLNTFGKEVLKSKNIIVC